MVGQLTDAQIAALVWAENSETAIRHNWPHRTISVMSGFSTRTWVALANWGLADLRPDLSGERLGYLTEREPFDRLSAVAVRRMGGQDARVNVEVIVLTEVGRDLARQLTCAYDRAVRAADPPGLRP